jgi:hypothetical protein
MTWQTKVAKSTWGKATEAYKAWKKKKGLKSSGTDTIKFKPGVGGLKKSRDMFENLQKSVKTGVEKFGRPHTTKVLSEQKGKKSLGSIVKETGDLERQRKKLGITKEQLSKGKKQ